MNRLKILTLHLAITLVFSTVYAQNVEQNTGNVINTDVIFSPNKYWLDTINMFGFDEKDSRFYNIRKMFAVSDNKLFSEKLMRINEPSLYNNYCYESYRFSWFRSDRDSHNTLSVRIENHDGNIFLIAKYVPYTSNNRKRRQFNSVNLIIDTIYLGQKEWDIFKHKLVGIDFWNIPPVEKTDIISFHCPIWIFEGNNDGLYHMVHRECGWEKEIGDICLYLLKLSNIPIKKKWFY